MSAVSVEELSGNLILPQKIDFFKPTFCAIQVYFHKINCAAIKTKWTLYTWQQVHRGIKLFHGFCAKLIFALVQYQISLNCFSNLLFPVKTIIKTFDNAVYSLAIWRRRNEILRQHVWQYWGIVSRFCRTKLSEKSEKNF